MNTLVSFILLLLALKHASVISRRNITYKIVEIDERFRFPNNYAWRSSRYPPSDGNYLFSYSTLRVDDVTSKWNLSNFNETTDNLVRIFNDSSIRCPIFNPRQFLSMIRDKNMGIFGDSIAKQMFNGVQNCLTPYITEYRNVFGAKVPHSEPEHVVALYFEKYKAIIYYCEDSYVTLDRAKKCVRNYLNKDTGFFVFGVAAHYSPKFIESHRNESMGYNESFRLSQQILRNDIARARSYLSTHLPDTKVIWRLQSHASNYNELKHIYNVSTEDITSLQWSDPSVASHWVPVYNDILLKEANKWNDPVIDWHTLSYQYMNYFSSKRGIAVHVDSMHYFTDGVPRGGALLLQDAVYESLHGL